MSSEFANVPRRPIRGLLIALAACLWAVPAHAGSIFDDDFVGLPTPKSPTAVVPRTSPPETTRPATTAPTATPDEPPSGRPATQPSAAAASSPPPKHPIPGAADQARSRKLFKEAFAEELKDRTPKARRALATQLLARADEVRTNRVDYFVLLIGARDAAAEGGDLPTAFRAADAVGSTYEVDPVRLKADTALKASFRAGDGTATATPKPADNCRAALDVVDALIAADDVATATRLLNAVQALGASDNALAAEVQVRTRLLAALRGAQDRVAAAGERLKKNPKDPAASYTVGGYLCFLKGDWARGLPLLAAGDNALVKAAAAADTAASTSGSDDSAAAVTAGDAWWSAAEREGAGPAASAMRQHAATFYDRALAAGKVDGLAKVKLEKRLASLPPSELPKPVAGGPFTPPRVGTPRNVLLFVGNSHEKGVFGPLSQNRMRVVERAEIAETLASFPSALSGVSVVVWGRNVFRDTPVTQITEEAQQAMLRFVKDGGGDLVFFEQFAAGNMNIVEKLFPVKVGGGPTGAIIAHPELQARATAAGYTETTLASVHFYNSYRNLPPEATVFLKSPSQSGEALPTAVLIPVGKGRLIMIGTNMDPADQKLDEEFFDLIYSYRTIKPGVKPR